MRKVLLSGVCTLASLFGGGNLYAQTTTEVTFTPSSDGKTLIISGQGDLTSYETTDWSSRLFTDQAVGFVFTDDKGTGVNAGDSYLAGNTYYQAEYVYKKVWEGAPVPRNEYFGEVNTNHTWKEDKIANLYTGYYDNNLSFVVTGKVTSDTKIEINSWDIWTAGGYTNMTKYVLSDKELIGETTIPLDDLESNGITPISLSDFQDYINTQATYQVWNPLFVSSDGGETYHTRVAGKDYTWTPGEVFYTRIPSYTQIEDNEAFFGEKGLHPDYIKADDTKISFLDLLSRKIKEGVYTSGNNVEGKYETIKFVNENSKEPLLINNDIVHAIMYPICNGYPTSNKTTKTLDLGETTINNLSAEAFGLKDYYYLSTAVENLTLPQTNKTSVFSETTQQDEDKMIVPTNILGGYCTQLKTLTIPDGYDRIGKKAFAERTAPAEFHLPKGLTLIGDSAFYSCTNLKEIQLSDSLQNIGKSAFSGTGLTDITFPSKLKMIDDAAFLNCKIFNLKFNAGLKYIGNSAFAISGNDPKTNPETTLEIPASVRYIGPFAFALHYYQDVFFYSNRAPIMPYGETIYMHDQGIGSAFSGNIYMGNNGFESGKGYDFETEEHPFDDAYVKGYANRENYKTHGVYFTMLHYPKDLDDKEREAYTDITRIYKTAAENQTFRYAKTDGDPNTYIAVGQEEENLIYNGLDAAKNLDFGFQDTYLGRQYVWPSQEMWRRSYVVNSLGYNWDGVTPFRAELTDGDLAILAYAGYKVGNGKGEYTLDELQRIAHMGTRQFVLTNADVNEDKKENEEPEYPVDIKGGEWWTICLPFDMTKKQIDDTFGKDTHVCRFNRVDRLTDDQNNKYIHLYFTNDVYVHKSTKDAEGNYTTSTGTATDDDDIVIYAHESYMIRPTTVKTGDDPVFYVKDYKLKVGSPLPTLVDVNASYQTRAANLTPDNSITDANKEYRFVGNYQTQLAVSEQIAAAKAAGNGGGVATMEMKTVTIPQYSYIFAAKKGQSAQFWFYTGTQAAWLANRSVVQATAKDGGAKDYVDYFGGGGTSGAKKAIENSFFGEDSETTGVEKVIITAGDGDHSEIVYNLNGQRVSENGIQTGLQKGIYIKNGKKIMVR